MPRAWHIAMYACSVVGVMVSTPYTPRYSQAYVKDVAKVFAPGDAVTAVVIRVDPKDGVINLSTKMLEAKPGEMLRTKEACFARAAAAGGERVEAVLAAIDGEQ